MSFWLSILRYGALAAVFFGKSALAQTELVIQSARPGKQVTETGKFKLRDPETVRKVIAKYHWEKAYYLPREGLNKSQRREAVALAKKQLLTNAAVLKRLKEQQKDKSKPEQISTSSIYAANRAVAGIIGSMGEPGDIKWMTDHLDINTAFVGASVAQIMSRHDMPFEPDSSVTKPRVRVAIALANKRNKAAAKWLYRHHQEIREKKFDPLFGMMSMLVINQLPEAKDFAVKMLTKHRDNFDGNQLRPSDQIDWKAMYAVPWAIAAVQAWGSAEEIRKHLAGIGILDPYHCGQEITSLISANPDAVLRRTFGMHEDIQLYQKDNIKHLRWHRPQVRAAFAMRDQKYRGYLKSMLSAELTELEFRHKINQNDRRTTYNTHRHCLNVDLSHHDLSRDLANRIQQQSGPKPQFVAYYYQAPWILMEWSPALIREHLADWFYVGLYYRPSRLSPFSHERLVEELSDKGIQPDCSVESFLLVHRYLNQSFKAPAEQRSGGTHCVALRLPGTYSSIGVHSIINTLVRRSGNHLTVGMRIKSTHADNGGLASMIGDHNRLIQPYYDNHCRKQVKNLRWECHGKSGTLEYMKTSDSGTHFFKGQIPEENLNDLHLYYDWQFLDQKHVLGHVLYEPAFEP